MRRRYTGGYRAITSLHVHRFTRDGEKSWEVDFLHQHVSICEHVLSERIVIHQQALKLWKNSNFEWAQFYSHSYKSPHRYPPYRNNCEAMSRVSTTVTGRKGIATCPDESYPDEYMEGKEYIALNSMSIGLHCIPACKHPNES